MNLFFFQFIVSINAGNWSSPHINNHQTSYQPLQAHTTSAAATQPQLFAPSLSAEISDFFYGVWQIAGYKAIRASTPADRGSQDKLNLRPILSPSAAGLNRNIALRATLNLLPHPNREEH